VAWVTAIGPNEAQVEYRLTGRHGCATSDASMVAALPVVEAIQAHAASLGVPPESLLTSERQRQIWDRVTSQTGARGEDYQIKASTAQGLLKAAGVAVPGGIGEELASAAAAEADPRIAYRMDSNERPLGWIGSGVREFGITPGSELTSDQWDMARAMMRGVDPRTGEQLVEPKTAVDPRGKLPAAPLVAAIQRLAAERGVTPESLFSSKRKADTYGRMARETARLGDAHRVRLGDVAKLADFLKISTVELYGQAAMDRALQFEDKRVVVGNKGFDLTINLPKAFSVALAFADGEFAQQLEEVFVTSLTESVQAAEEWTAYGMRGHHGGGESAERVQNTGLMGWVNFHRAARPVGEAPFGDPHMHGHVTLANLGKGEDGKWSTIAAGGRDLYRHARAIDALMQARVRAVTHERWGFEWQRDGDSGVWQIVGIPAETIELFSKRSHEVKALFAALGINYSETTTAMQKTAAAKLAGAKGESVSAPDSTLRAYWQAEAEAAGQDPAAIIGAVLSPTFPPTGEDAKAKAPRDASDIDAVARWVFRVDEGLTSHRKDFTRAEALAAVADAAANGVISRTQVEELTDRVLSHRGMTVRLGERLPEHLSNTARYTTADIVVAERRILAETRGRFGDGSAVVDEATFAMSVSTYQTIQRATDPEFSLSAEQLAVLRRILLDGHGVDAVIGVAGAGKTTIMEVARLAWEAQGQVVMGASTAAVAAANLRSGAGIESSTLAMLLTRTRTGSDPLRGVDVLVLDEAAMVDDRQLAELLAYAGQMGTKVVGIGDPQQLQSPGVGGGFAAIHEVVSGYTLATNYRQRDAIERRALQFWRDGQRREALQLFADHGRVHVTETRQEAMAAIVVAWQGHRDGSANIHDQIAGTLILAARNVDVDELNMAVRAVRRELGELSGPDVEYRLKGGATVAFAVGDMVMIRKNDYRSWGDPDASDVLNGYRGAVVAIDERRRVLVEWRDKAEDGQHRLTREWLDVDYIAQGGLSHGIAMTVHKAQGLTVGDVLVYGQGLAANGAYTALSRDRDTAHLFLARREFEDEATRITLGEPATEAEAMSRTLAGFANALDTNDGQEALVVTELGERLEPLIPRQQTAPTVEEEDAGLAATATGPAERTPRQRHADAIREALADHAEIDADQVLADASYGALEQALTDAAEAGLDPAEVLERVAAERAVDDAESLARVLAWRVDRETQAEAEEPSAAVEDQADADAYAEADADAAAVAATTTAAEEADEPREVRPGWRERPHGALTDAELDHAHAAAAAAAEQAAAAAERAGVQAQVQQETAEAGTGSAATAVQAQADALQQRAEAVRALADIAPAYEQAGTQMIELRARLAEVESGMDARRRGQRERAAAEAAGLRGQLETVHRTLIELDIKRDELDRLAGPERTRVGAVEQWQAMAPTLPQTLERARTSDLQDADLASTNARTLQQRADEAAAQVGALSTEQAIRAGLTETEAFGETVARATARLSAPAAEERFTADVEAYGYDEAERLERDREAQDGQGRGL